MDGPANRLKSPARLDGPPVLIFGTPKRIRQIAPNYPVDPFRRPGGHPTTAKKPRAERGLELCKTTPNL
jgi:hypothetical protein